MVNVATRQINLANAFGVGDWGERIGIEIVLALSIPDSMEEDCAAVIGCKDMLNTWGAFTIRLIC